MITQEAWSSLWARIQLNQDRLSLSYQAGIAVGRFARQLGLPLRYLEAAVTQITEEWNFVGRRLMPWRSNKNFYDGVRIGFMTLRANYIEDGSAVSNDASNVETESEVDMLVTELKEIAAQTIQSPCANAIEQVVQGTQTFTTNAQPHSSLEMQSTENKDEASIPKFFNSIRVERNIVQNPKASGKNSWVLGTPDESNALGSETMTCSEDTLMTLDFNSLDGIEEEQEGSQESALAVVKRDLIVDNETYAYAWTGM